MFYNK